MLVVCDQAMPRGLDGTPAVVKLLVGVVVQSFLVMAAHTASARYASHVYSSPGRTPCSPFCPDFTCNVSAAPPDEADVKQVDITFAEYPRDSKKCHVTLTPVRLDLILFVVFVLITTVFNLTLYVISKWS